MSRLKPKPVRMPSAKRVIPPPPPPEVRAPAPAPALPHRREGIRSSTRAALALVTSVLAELFPHHNAAALVINPGGGLPPVVIPVGSPVDGDSCVPEFLAPVCGEALTFMSP